MDNNSNTNQKLITRTEYNRGVGFGVIAGIVIGVVIGMWAQKKTDLM